MDSLAPVPLPDDIQRRLTSTGRPACAVLLIAVWGWFALVKNDQTPIFVYHNVAVHETGHVPFRPFGELTMLIMGWGLEVVFPLGVGVYVLLRERDLVAHEQHVRPRANAEPRAPLAAIDEEQMWR